MAVLTNTKLEINEAAAPDTPSTGKVALYAKTDGLFYSKDDAGTETAFSPPVKAIGSEINTGSDDAKFATAKAITDSNLSFTDGAETLTNKKIQDTAAPATDAYTGIQVSLTAHENLTLGQVGYINSDGEVAKADATVIATSSALVMATAAITANVAGICLLNGVIHLHTLAPGWTVGGLVYLSLDAGGLTQTAPTATDEVIQILGVALAADILYFNPQLVQVEHV
jgi:hypothetical protein